MIPARNYVHTNIYFMADCLGLPAIWHGGRGSVVLWHRLQLVVPPPLWLKGAPRMAVEAMTAAPVIHRGGRLYAVYSDTGEVLAYCASAEAASDLIAALELGSTQRMQVLCGTQSTKKHTGYGEL
jgi:hypothetical protein